MEFFGIKEVNGQLYMIMEFMNNGSVLEYVRSTQLTESTLKDMALQIAFGMSYLEEKGIIHRYLSRLQIISIFSLLSLIVIWL